MIIGVAMPVQEEMLVSYSVEGLKLLAQQEYQETGNKFPKVYLGSFFNSTSHLAKFLSPGVVERMIEQDKLVLESIRRVAAEAGGHIELVGNNLAAVFFMMKVDGERDLTFEL
jgi:hypothetical protein